MKHLILFISLVLIFAFSLFGQSTKLDDIHLFQTFLKDAPISKTPYGEAGIQYGTSEFFSSFLFGIQGGYPINREVEIDANLGFSSISPDIGDSQSGLTDLTVTGRYNIMPKKTNISVGGLITLPIGSEDVGQSNFNFGAFGALRHPLEKNMIITGTLGIDFIETINTLGEDNREASLIIGGGLIYNIDRNLNVLGELNIRTKIDYAFLSGGVNYELPMGSFVRGSLGVGLNDGAPDFAILASFFHFFK